MSKSRKELTKLEWRLMDALWDAKQATAADLQKSLSDSQGWAYSTVKTMLDRLVAMEFVKARRVGNVNEYSPKLRRPTVVGRVVDDLKDRLFEGSATPFIQCLLDRNNLTKEEVGELMSILKQHENNTKK